MKLSRRLFLLSPLALAYKPSWGALSFPLPQGHFVPAKMPMHPVFPRPDSETQPYARHRWAHPDFRYEIPIGVQGGAWPFKYEVINGPTGATIGQYYGDADYGVVKWTPSNGDSGTKTFTVRVTDQELNTVDLTWTTTIDPNQFIFIDSSAPSAGTGSISSPLKSFADWYTNSETDATYKQKIAVFRRGTYALYASSGGTARFDSNYKSVCIIGYPDETPIFDCTNATLALTGNASDAFFANIRFEHATPYAKNPRMIGVYTKLDRVTIWKNYFYDLTNGTVGDDNCSGLYCANNGSPTYYWLVKHNTFDEFTNHGSNGSYVDLYYTYYGVIEENTAKNSSARYGFWAKVTKAYVTLRANDLSKNITGGGITVHYGDNAPGQPHDHEICWNKVVIPINLVDLLSLLIMGDNPSDINRNHYNTFIYRNTFVGGRAVVRFGSPVENFKVDANVVVSDRSDAFSPVRSGSAAWNEDIIDTLILNLTGTKSTQIVDTNGMLVGDYRKRYLGIIGHEISDKYLTIPMPPKLLS